MINLIRFKKNTAFITSILILMVIFAISYKALTSRDTNSPVPERTLQVGKLDIPTEKNYWENRLNSVDPKQVYKEFKSAYANTPFSAKHPLSHMIGYLFYKKLGVNGFSICDDSFAYGCYHGFFEGVFIDHDIEVIKDLNQACIERYGPIGTGCQHGIGHGLMAYFGREQLIKALDACAYTHQQHPLHGCTAGVFMEYNSSMHFSTDSAVVDVRKLNPNDPYEPCDTLASEDFQKSCYFEIPLWWKSVYGDSFEKLGKLCQALTQQENRLTCFKGVGVIVAPSANFDIEKGTNMCQDMPSEEGRSQCVSGASAVSEALKNI